MNFEPLSFERVDFEREWESSREEWADLHRRAVDPCSFYHPVFLQATRDCGGARPTHLVLGRRAGRLEFATPLEVRRTGFISEARLFARRGFDHLAPLDTSIDRSGVGEFVRWAESSRLGHVLTSTALAEDALESLANGHSFSRPGFRCPYLELPPNTDDLFTMLSANMRSSLRRKARQATAAGVDFHTLGPQSSSQELVRAFETLVSLHQARFRASDRHSAFLEGDALEYHRAVLAADRGADRIVRFVEARRDDEVLASLYGFLIRDRFLFFQSGFAPSASDLSPGALVMHRSLEAAIAEGARTYDFLRGADAYKARWTAQYTTDRFLIRPWGPLGRAGALYLRLRRAAWRQGRWQGLFAVLQSRD